jgi:hypothetical protein
MIMNGFLLINIDINGEYKNYKILKALTSEIFRWKNI